MMIKRMLMASLVVGFLGGMITLTGCEKDTKKGGGEEQTENAREVALKAANAEFVDKVVIPTYTDLAAAAKKLDDLVIALEADVNATNIKAACDQWFIARELWERSEAFLFGAAKKYSIDPHIDTWPVDAASLQAILDNEELMKDVEKTVGNLNTGVVGFHGLEYIIFRDGKPRDVSSVTEQLKKELKFAVAVANDLYVSTVILKVAWKGEGTEAENKILEDTDHEIFDNFGEQMKLAGQAGSIYKSVVQGSQEIIEGMSSIVDEVGAQKMGKPYNGEDINYIESPYAHNSLVDFQDNIISIRSSYFGKMDATAPEPNSLASFLEKNAPEKDKAIRSAIDKAFAAIKACPAPFKDNFTKPEVKTAIDACDALKTALDAGKEALAEK